MDPVSLAGLLRDYGPWGLLALLILCLRWLFLRYDAAQEARIELGEKTALALKDSADAIREVSKVVERQGDTLDGQARSLETLNVRLEERAGRVPS